VFAIILSHLAPPGHKTQPTQRLHAKPGNIKALMLYPLCGKGLLELTPYFKLLQGSLHLLRPPQVV